MPQQSTEQQGQPVAGDTTAAQPPIVQKEEVQTEAGEPAVSTGSAQLVPVTESIRYRKRAQQAERESADLKRQLDEQRQAARRLETELTIAQRRNSLTRLLAGRGVIDIDAALLLAEQRIAGQRLAAASSSFPARGSGRGETCDAATPGCDPSQTDDQVVEQLLKDKPYLVKPAESVAPASTSATLTTPTMGRRSERASTELLRSAAQRAAGTGRGPELEHYLRLRRRAKG